MKCISVKRSAVVFGCLTVLLSLGTLWGASADLRLVEAVKKGDQSTIRSLLAQKMDVNAPQADGATALAWAAHRNDLETAELLIQAGANVDAANDYGVSPLSLSCTNGSSAMVEKLLKAGANPNVAQWTGETVLMTCSRAGNLGGVRSLLAFKADVTAADKDRGQTALMWAVGQKHADVAELLIKAGANVHTKSKTLPVLRNFLKAETYTADTHYPETTGGYTPLLFAARVGDIDSARVLLEAGADVNAGTPEDGTALVLASAGGHEQLALFLLGNGADPNAADAHGITALHWSMREGMKALIGVGSSPTDRFWYRANMPELAKALLLRGADPNAAMQKDFTPYDQMVFGHGMGNFLPQVSMVGMTPFTFAAASGDVGSMRLLVENGSDPRIVTMEGTTALMVAAGVSRERENRSDSEKEQLLEAVKLALQLGGDINAANADGRTALHGAAYLGDTEMIRFLAENGANMDAKDIYGQTPLSIAMGDPEGLVYRQLPGASYDYRFRQPKKGQDKIAALLLELGAAPFEGEYRDRSGQ